MTGKKIAFGGKPQNTTATTSDDWVKTRVIPDTLPEVKMKRLTLDVSEDLHRRIKSACANRGVKMADEIRTLLETHFT